MAQVDLEALEDAAKTKASRAIEYIRTVHVDPPRFSLLTGLIFFVIWAAGTWGYGWWKAHERDKWWRTEIMVKSQKVNAAVAKANMNLPDDEILKALGETDVALWQAEERLKQKPAAPSSDCPVLPARCLFKR